MGNRCLALESISKLTTSLCLADKKINFTAWLLQVCTCVDGKDVCSIMGTCNSDICPRLTGLTTINKDLSGCADNSQCTAGLVCQSKLYQTYSCSNSIVTATNHSGYCAEAAPGLLSAMLDDSAASITVSRCRGGQLLTHMHICLCELAADAQVTGGGQTPDTNPLASCMAYLLAAGRPECPGCWFCLWLLSHLHSSYHGQAGQQSHLCCGLPKA